MRPILERSSGLRSERDFFLAYWPEREDPGNPEFTTGDIPKARVVRAGGLGPGERVYDANRAPHRAGFSLETAEAVKLIEKSSARSTSPSSIS